MTATITHITATCRFCKGTGRVAFVDFRNVWAGLKDAKQCRPCRGTGHVVSAQRRGAQELLAPFANPKG